MLQCPLRCLAGRTLRAAMSSAALLVQLNAGLQRLARWPLAAAQEVQLCCNYSCNEFQKGFRGTPHPYHCKQTQWLR